MGSEKPGTVGAEAANMHEDTMITKTRMLMTREKRHRKSEASSTATTVAAITQLREKTALNPVFIPTVFTARGLAGGRRWSPNPQPSRSWWSARRMVIINAASAAAAAQNNKMTSNTSWTSKQAGRQAAGSKITPYAPPIVVVVPMPLFYSLAPCPYTSFHRRSPFKKYFHIKNRVFSSFFCPALA